MTGTDQVDLRTGTSLAGRRVFVTGAAGWIGSHVLRRLISEHATVYALIRPTTDLWRLTGLLEQVQTITCDLDDSAGVVRTLQQIRPEVCLHLAWPSEPGKYAEDRRNLSAVSETVRLVTLLADVGCRRFVGAGSCAEYDASFGWLSENTPTRPQSLYGAAKLATWLLIEQVAKGGLMTVAWARLFYQFGPMEDERRLVPGLVAALRAGQTASLTPGEQVRDFLHVSDVASALVTIASSEQAGVFNIGSGQPTTVADVARQVARALGSSDSLRFGARSNAGAEPLFICANTARLRSTGWQPAYNLLDGITETVRWSAAKNEAA